MNTEQEVNTIEELAELLECSYGDAEAFFEVNKENAERLFAMRFSGKEIAHFLAL